MAIERLSASNAAKHMACHASANLEAAIPGWTPPDIDDTQASAKGTDLHKIAELSGGYTPKEQQGLAEAIMYVAQLRQTRRFKQLLEVTGEGWWLASKPKTQADVVLYVKDEIHVVDYKFGKIPVDVFGNVQGKYYSLVFSPLAPKATGVRFHIVQPFANNIDSCFFSKQDLEQFMLESQAAETAIVGGDTTFTPGDHCQFCPANPHSRGVKGTPFCPAMMAKLYPHQALDVDDALS